MLSAGAAGGVMVVTSVAVPPPDPPPENVAEFVTVAGAFAATFTVTVMGPKLLPDGRLSLRVQLTVPRSHVQPGPLMPVAARPAGIASLTVMAPLVEPAEAPLRTVMVYVAPFCPCTK